MHIYLCFGFKQIKNCLRFKFEFINNPLKSKNQLIMPKNSIYILSFVF